MQKRESRVGVSEEASLKSGPNSFPCALVNMSDHGFLIRCSKAFQIGQILEFSCELYPSKTLNCKIEIRHISAAGMGTKIVDAFWTLGPYDVVLVAEAPDDETMTAFALKLGSFGNVKTQTLRAFRANEMDGILSKAK